MLWCQPSRVIEVITRAGEIAWYVYECCGFRLNWGPTKTAALVHWHGPDSRVCKAELQQKHGNRVTLRNGTREAKLEIVDEYKRVGTTRTDTDSYGREIHIRVAAAWHKLSGLRKRLFRAPGVKQQAKCETLRSLFLSSQLFNPGGWPELLIGEYKLCKKMLLRV